MIYEKEIQMIHMKDVMNSVFLAGELENSNQYMPKMIKEVLAIPGLTGLFVATLFAGKW